jgi:hypothetical protein
VNLRSLLLVSLVSLVPAAAHAAIDLDDPGDDTGGGGGTPTPTPPPPAPAWQKTYSKAQLFGSSSWGAGYTINGSMTAMKADATHADRLAASMSAETYGKISGSYHRLFAARVAGSTEANARTDLSFNAYAGTATVYTRSYTSLTSSYTFASFAPVTWPVTFFDRSVSVGLSFVSVSFRARATGELKAGLTGKISNKGIEAAAAPSGKASLYVSAAIGGDWCLWGACIGATAGVYSDVTLVQASVPAQAALWWSISPELGGVSLNYLTKADLTVSALDGELGVYASACLGWCTSDSATLIDWTGYTASYRLIKQSGSHCLTGTCSLVFNP